MRLVNYQHHSRQHLGVLMHDRIMDLQAVYRLWQQHSPNLAIRKRLPVDLLRLLQIHGSELRILKQLVDFSETLPASRQTAIPFARAHLLPPILRPGKVIAVGLNYPPYPADGSPPPPYPVLFHKTASSLTGHNTAIRIPHATDQVEYEGEVAVIIGKTGRNIRLETAILHVAGYTIANDVGARDWQQRSSQWTSGKMADTFCPLGPALVTVDEIPDPSALHICTQVNGERMQDAPTSEMIFDVPALVSYISEVCTLEAGDIILTGSPKRAGDRPDPRRYLKPGDMVQITITGLGMLSNPVIKEQIP